MVSMSPNEAPLNLGGKISPFKTGTGVTRVNVHQFDLGLSTINNRTVTRANLTRLGVHLAMFLGSKKKLDIFQSPVATPWTKQYVTGHQGDKMCIGWI
jgi:hypothetical protein